QQMRLLEYASRSDSANHARELQRSRGDGALPRRHGDRFTGIPLAMENALDPFCGRHQPGQLLGEIDSRLASEAELAPVVRKAVNAQAHSGIVEKDVARLEDGFVQPHDTV